MVNAPALGSQSAFPGTMAWCPRGRAHTMQGSVSVRRSLLLNLLLVILVLSAAIIARGELDASAPVPASVLAVRRPDHLMLLLADATGHGVGPALSAAQVRAMLRMAIRTGAGLPTIAAQINEQLCDDLFGGRFITAWLARLDIEKCALVSFSAGQAPLLHYRAETAEMRVLDADTRPLGVLRDLEVAVADPIELAPGDVFTVLSDGILEAPDGQGERFGVERAIQVIATQPRSSASDLLQALRRALDEFTRERPPDDDVTAIVLKRTR